MYAIRSYYAVAYPTVTVPADACDKTTVTVTAVVPELPSATETLTGLIDTTGTSSLVIVTVDVAVPNVAPVGADNVTVNVSSASTVASPATETMMS